MNLDFIPTHCFFCGNRVSKALDIFKIRNITCPRCRLNSEPAFWFFADNGFLKYLYIRVKNYEVVWCADLKITKINQLNPPKLLLILDFLLDFDFNPEKLVHKVKTLLVFS